MILALGLLVVIAAEDPTGGTLPSFASAGIAGALVVAILLGFLWPKPAVDKIVASEARAIARGDALELVLKEGILPVLRDVAKATGQGGPLEKISEKVDRIERRLDSIGAAGGDSTRG